MSAPEEARRSLLSKYASKGALTYYALSLPAIVATVAFSSAISSNPSDLLAQAAPSGSAVAAAIQLLPLALVVGSLFALFTLRPSLLVTLFIASFFVAASVANGIAFLGSSSTSGTRSSWWWPRPSSPWPGSATPGPQALGRAASQCHLFRPAAYNALGIALDSAVPLAAALVLVVLVETVVGDLGVQAADLPPPLATLATLAGLYLQSRVGLVFTTLFVAGAAIWVMRQFLEPVILHFTLNSADAEMGAARGDRADDEDGVEDLALPAVGRARLGLPHGAYCAGLVAALAIFLPQGQFSHDLLAAFNLQAPSPTPVEVLLQSTIQNAIVRIDILYAQSQDYIRSMIRLLWG